MPWLPRRVIRQKRRGVLRLALLVVLVVLALQTISPTRGGSQTSTVDRGSLCDEHPHWSVGEEPTCGI
jgi:hypothetical protein